MVMKPPSRVGIPALIRAARLANVRVGVAIEFDLMLITIAFVPAPLTACESGTFAPEMNWRVTLLPLRPGFDKLSVSVPPAVTT